jgi:hypothetical protein
MYNKVNVNNGIEESIDMNTGKQLKINTVAPTKNEIRNAIKKTKNGRAAGTDNIPNESYKANILTVIEVFHKIFKKIWEKEEIPRDWKEGIIVKVPKKGDLTECSNWRGITLLNTSSKLLTRIMLERKKERKEIDKKLRENQAGFRAKRSCTNHIATIH